MTKARAAPTKQDLFDYFVRLTALLGLEAWEFYLGDDGPGEGVGAYLADASIEINDHAQMATVSIADHLLEPDKGTPEYLRRVFVHEALHCHRQKTASMVRLDLEALLGKTADALFWSSYARLREHEIEALARVIAPHYPLPAWTAQLKRS